MKIEKLILSKITNYNFGNIVNFITLIRNLLLYLYIILYKLIPFYI